MGLFSKGGHGESVALIDINSSSVGGALVRFEEGKQPTLFYTVREPFENGDYVSVLTVGMLRALAVVGEKLVREGAPALRSGAGDGSVERIVVCVGAPWQETTVETKILQKTEPFTFTKSLVVEALQGGDTSEDRLTSRSVIATLLNGYSVSDPYGKEVHRAEMVVLSSSMEKRVIESVEEALHTCFHTRELLYTSFAEPAFVVLRDLYPHEKDFLMISVTGEATVIASVKRGHLLDVGWIDCGSRAFAHEQMCIDSLTGALKGFATRHALPRTVFVITNEGAEDILKTALDTSSLRALWLSDEPVTVLPLQPSHFSGKLKVQGLAEGDTRLELLALYAARQGS